MTDEAGGQRWNADDYASNARFVVDLAASLVDWLAPRAGERILDLGCGDGAMTEKLAAGGADVHGVDASPEMVAAAVERGVKAQVMDGAQLTFDGEFDAVFSNAALHWMKRDPDAVVAGVHRALKSGGRFVAEMGARGNCQSVRDTLSAACAGRGLKMQGLDPWYFPAPDAYRSKLETAGFSVERMESFDRPTPLPGDVTDWLKTFGQSFLRDLPAGQGAELMADVRTRLAPKLCRDGQWVLDYVRLRFVAIRLD